MHIECKACPLSLSGRGRCVTAQRFFDSQNNDYYSTRTAAWGTLPECGGLTGIDFCRVLLLFHDKRGRQQNRGGVATGGLGAGTANSTPKKQLVLLGDGTLPYIKRCLLPATRYRLCCVPFRFSRASKGKEINGSGSGRLSECLSEN